MLQVANRSFEGPRCPGQSSKGRDLFPQGGRSGTFREVHRTFHVLHTTGATQHADRMGCLSIQCSSRLAQQHHKNHCKVNDKSAEAENVASHDERRVLRQIGTGHLKSIMVKNHVQLPWARTCAAVALAFTTALFPAQADELGSLTTSAFLASSMIRSQHPAQPQRHRGPDLVLDKQSGDKQSGDKQSESLTSSVIRQDELMRQGGQPQLPTLKAPVQTCGGPVGHCVKENLSAVRVAAWEGLSRLDLAGVSAGLVSGAAVGAVAMRGVLSSSIQTVNGDTYAKFPAEGRALPPRDLSQKDTNGCGGADFSYSRGIPLDHDRSCLCSSNNSHQLCEKESTVACDPQSDGRPGDELEADDADTGVRLSYSTDSDSELEADRPCDEVIAERLTTCPGRILPDWELDPVAINIVVDNQTSKPIVLFADDARPDAEDLIRTAWKVFKGPAAPQLLQVRPNRTEIGATRVEGRNLVLRSGPFPAESKSTWVMLQPTPHHTAWMRGATAKDDFYGTGSEGRITVLNLRKVEWPPYDFQLFVEGELCAVHAKVEKGKAYQFQAPSVLSFGVPRPGMNIRKGSVFDRDVSLDDSQVDLDLKLLQIKGDQVCWIKLGHDAELNSCWQLDVFDVETPNF